MQVQKDPFKSDVLTLKPFTLMNFGAPWCSLCLMVQPVLNRFSAEWYDTIDVVSINVDKHWQMARQYDIRSLPTLLLLSREGIVLERLTQFRSREDLLYRCEQLMQTRLQHI